MLKFSSQKTVDIVILGGNFFLRTRRRRRESVSLFPTCFCPPLQIRLLSWVNICVVILSPDKAEWHLLLLLFWQKGEQCIFIIQYLVRWPIISVFKNWNVFFRDDIREMCIDYLHLKYTPNTPTRSKLLIETKSSFAYVSIDAVQRVKVRIAGHDLLWCSLKSLKSRNSVK